MAKESKERTKKELAAIVASKIDDAKGALKNNEFLDALVVLRAAELYAERADIDVAKDIEKMRIEAYREGINIKIENAEKALDNEEVSDAIAALVAAEKYAEKAGVKVPEKIKTLKQKTFSIGVGAYLKSAKAAIKEGEYSDALGPLNLVEKYAKESKTKVPNEVETLRKNAYSMGVKTKLEEAKKALKDGEYADAIGISNVIENMYAPKAGIPVPKEISEIKDKAYSLGVKGKIKETKEALSEGEFEDALSGIAGIEIYAKKAGIPVPKEIETLRKEAYMLSAKGKISEAKELIEENDPDALSSLRVAIAYSKKADSPLPKEIEKLMPKAYKVGMAGKITEAKESIEQEEPQDALVALLVAEKYAKESGISVPSEVEKIRKEVYLKGTSIMLEKAKTSIKEGEYSDALGPLNLAEKYAKESKTKVPKEVETLRKEAYKKGVKTKIEEAKQALKDGEYADAIGACNVIENMYAPKAGIPVPKEISEIKDKAYNLGVKGKLKETKEALSEGEFEDALSGIAGIEIYAKKAGIPVPKEIETLRKEAYTLSAKGKISEATELIEENNPDALSSLKVAIAYSKKADLPLPKEIETLMPKAYKIGMAGKITEAKESIEQEEPQDALVALVVAEKYAREAGVSVPAEAEKIRKEAYLKGINIMLKKAKTSIKEGEYSDALGPLNLAEKYAKESKTEVPKEVGTLRKDAYKKGVKTKIEEAKQVLKDGEGTDAVGMLNVAELYAKRAEISVPGEVEGLKRNAYELSVNNKFDEVKKALDSGDYSDALGALAGVEIYAKRIGVPSPSGFEDMKQKAYKLAIDANLQNAKKAKKDKDYTGLEASTNFAEMYAKKGGMNIPSECIELRRFLDDEGYFKKKAENAIDTAMGEAKVALNNKSYDDALGALAVVEMHAKDAGLEVPAEVEDVKQKAYRIAIETNLEASKRAVSEKDYDSAPASLSLVEMYSKKAGIDVPSGTDEIRAKVNEYIREKNIKEIYNRINDAKNAISNEEYLDALGALNVSEFHAKDTNTQIPPEIESLRQKAYELGVKVNMKNARESLEKKDYTQTDLSLSLVRLYSKESGVPIPPEHDEINAQLEDFRVDKISKSLDAALQEARDALDKGEHMDAIGSLNIVNMYAKKSGMEYPKETKMLMKEAYELGMKNNIGEAKEALSNNDIEQARIFANIADMYAKNANIPYSPEIKELREKIEEKT